MRLGTGSRAEDWGLGIGGWGLNWGLDWDLNLTELGDGF
jgi:hypothetical protein